MHQTLKDVIGAPSLVSEATAEALTSAEDAYRMGLSRLTGVSEYAVGGQVSINVDIPSGGVAWPNQEQRAQLDAALKKIREDLEMTDAQRRQQELVRKFLKYLPDAKAAAGRSKDRSTKVGAVVIDDDFNVRISGYNGMPRGINDNVEARHERPTKYFWASHSEENCVAQAARVGVSLKGCTILLTALFPCTTCSRLIIQSGIKRVLAPRSNSSGDGGKDRKDWDEQSRVSFEMLAEAGVEVIYYTEGEEE